MTTSISNAVINEFINLRVGDKPLFPELTEQEIIQRFQLIPSNSKILKDSPTHSPSAHPATEEFAPNWRSPWLDVFEAARQLHFEFIDCSIIASAWIRQSIRCNGFDFKAWPTHGADFGLIDKGSLEILGSTRHKDCFLPCPNFLGLYAVAPNSETIRRLALLGVPTLQLRFKSSDPLALEAQVLESVEAVKGTGSLLFINDHWQLAIKAKAYGVHLGQEDLDTLGSAEIKLIKDSGLRIGISTHGYSEMVRADAVGPSYIAMGAIYPTTLKQMQTRPQGVGRLGKYVKLMSHYPTVAIGGIDATNIKDVLSTGVGSVAMVRALVAEDVNKSQILELLSMVKFE